ncbi:MAG: hypothetical protein ACRDHE_07695, partial [Ktedonobacterales bacterium]
MQLSSALRGAIVRACGRLAIVVTMAAMMILSVVPVGAHAATKVTSPAVYSHITRIGTGSIGRPQPGSAAVGTPEIQLDIEGDVHSGQRANSARTAAPVLVAPNPTPNMVAGSNNGASVFAGLDHYQNRTASNGNQFSLEPPDQGLCEGNG